MPDKDPVDVLVLGSGPSGAMAAAKLIELGLSVHMIDFGEDDPQSRTRIPDLPFSDLRQTDLKQADYFLGKDLQGIPQAGIRVGSQLTPPRQFSNRHSEELLPYDSSSFFPMQSLALGGLGSAWGAACYTFSPDELKKLGIQDEGFYKYYDEVAQEIGVSADTQSDCAHDCQSGATNFQKPLEIDSNSQNLLERYARLKARINRSGLTVGKAALASLSSPLKDRQPNPYHDMDFWSDSRKSTYRPRYTVEELQKQPNFKYSGNLLAFRFQEAGPRHVELHCKKGSSGETVAFSAKRLILCAGAINSARIALNSLGLENYKTSILSSPYTYVAAINLGMLGRKAKDRRHSLAQLFAIFRPKEDPSDLVSLQLYSYRSLLLFKLIKELPIPTWAGLWITRFILNSIMIAGIFHSDSLAQSTDCPRNWLKLEKMEQDQLPKLQLHYQPSKERSRQVLKRDRSIMWNFLKLGCIPCQRWSPGNAASIHYAGTIPFRQSSTKDEKFGCDSESKLLGTQTVYVGDSASWNFLPAKGLTWTIMANARRVATLVAKGLRS